MFAIERMTEEMRPEVMPMVDAFYNSDAVSHEVEREKLEQTFADAVSADPILEGYVLKEDGHIVGFGYVTVYYACEVGRTLSDVRGAVPEGGSQGKGLRKPLFRGCDEGAARGEALPPGGDEKQRRSCAPVSEAGL